MLVNLQGITLSIFRMKVSWLQGTLKLRFCRNDWIKVTSRGNNKHHFNNCTKCHKDERLFGVLKLEHSKQVSVVLRHRVRQETLTEKGRKPNTSGEGGQQRYKDAYWTHPKKFSRVAKVFLKADIWRRENNRVFMPLSIGSGGNIETHYDKDSECMKPVLWEQGFNTLF